MGFLLFAPLSFLVLWLTFRLRLRTNLWISVVIGLVGDMVLDMLVFRRP